MEVQGAIGRSTITQNKIMLWCTAIITVLFLPNIEKLWQHDSKFHWLSWICLIKNHSSCAYSKWMDLKALHDIFRFLHCIVVAKINWRQQFWIKNQFISTKECKFIFLDLIMIMLTLLWLLILVSNNFVAIFNKFLQFYVQCVDFCIQWATIVFSKPKFY